MALKAGTRLGPYEVTGSLGAGGMGEVYRARDTQLDRDVALKILPDSFADDPDRLARFEREAKTLAALNHPHIAQIYGLEKASGSPALVMELVDGEDLAERIARGPVALEDALSIARQIAEALEAAHEQGVVHRDLKPANIKVTPHGAVKVLDFGLAKLVEGPPKGGHYVTQDRGHYVTSDRSVRLQPDLAASPTILSPAMTGVGVLLGTAAYMAPEQASGKPVDKRADIWAFGVVLAEMLTGRRMFDGETVSHVLAAILTQEPDLTAVPSRVRPLLRRCLEKDPKKRLRDIGDAMSLVPATDVVPADGTRAGRSRWPGVIGWAVAGVLAIALAMVAWSWPRAAIDVDSLPVRFQIERAIDVYNRTTSAFAVSPDGLKLAYYGIGRDGLQALFIRTLATADVREVPGSASASPQGDSLFWSPDSRQLVRGTAAGGQIFDLAAGTTRSLCECRYVGGTWNGDGTILIGSWGSPGKGIWRLSPGDRAPVLVTTVDAAREQDTWPVFLPDGRRFLFTRSVAGGAATTYLGTLDGDAPVKITEGSRRVFVRASAGHGSYLAGIDPAGLVVQPFDPMSMRVTGAPVTVVPGAAAVSASQNGVLAMSPAGTRPRTIPTWFSRTGAVLGQLGDAGLIESVALSRDGRKLAVAESVASPRLVSDVWLQDPVTGGRTRFTFNPDNDSTPVWSPDGTQLAFTSNRNGVNLPYQRAANGTGAETPLFPYQWHAWVNDWSTDGRWVIFSSPTTRTTSAGNDLWFVQMDGAGGRKPVQYLATPALEQQAQFSPDGRFVAYGSDQSGAWEIYVQPFPDASQGKWMVSNGGGVEPRWSRDGKELFYFSGQTLMAAPITLQPTFSSGPPHALFDAAVQPGYTSDSHRWQVAPDGKRFLLLVYSGTNQSPPLDVIVNWLSLVKK